ncbi:MAG: DUF4034 domain-containing protein [Betaproteobacteria bacterium]|nr:DUF4034 domain-containing protein [Betaproteobacteria bacterium]
MKKALVLSLMLMVSCGLAQAQIGVGGMPGGTTSCTDLQLKTNVPCPDSTLAQFEGTLVVQRLYGASDFKGLDELFENWSRGTDRFPDGRWKLAFYVDGLSRQFEIWKTWGEDQKKIKAWQAKSPDSFAAKYIEAVYWRTYAWAARGSGYANTVAPEGWALFRERIGFAERILEELKPRAEKYPAWYSTAIFNKLDAGDSAAATEIFKRGQALFPDYHSIYFAMARAFEPRWGGSAESFDKFAREAAKLAKSSEAEGMYVRLFWTVDFPRGVPFDPKAGEVPEWATLKKGIEKLTQMYPSSTHNMNHFASLACRANDKALYLSLRTKLGNLADAESFKGATLEACDLRFGFSRKS